jgi:hypothetical protein
VYNPHSIGGGISSPQGVSGGPQVISQVISPSSLPDLGESGDLNCNEEIAGWIDRIQAPSAPGSSPRLSLRSLKPRDVRKFLAEYADYERMVTGGVRESGEPLELRSMKSFVDWEVLVGLQMEYQEEHLQHPKRSIPQAALLQALQKINDESPIESEGEEDSLVGAAAFPPPAVSRESSARALSSPAVVPAGGTGTRYIQRARRERTEQQVLRQGMARSPFGGPVRRTRDSSHPYKRGYTS